MAIPISVKNIKITNLDQYQRQRTIGWDLLLDPTIIGYNIYRSEVSYADFEKINSSLISPTINTYLDSAIPVTATMPFQWWYKVSAVNAISEESDLASTLPAVDFDIDVFINQQFIQNEPQKLSEQDKTQPSDSKIFQILPKTNVNPRWFLEIRKRYRWLLEMGGVKVILLKRRWSGTLCPNYDPLRNQHRQYTSASYDDPCYGAGFIGGYHTPLEISISFESPVVKKATLHEFGLWFEFEPKNWTLWEPNLLDRDIIVRPDTGERFEVTELTRTTWRNLVLRQNFDLRLLEPTNIVYKVPI